MAGITNRLRSKTHKDDETSPYNRHGSMLGLELLRSYQYPSHPSSGMVTKQTTSSQTKMHNSHQQ